MYYVVLLNVIATIQHISHLQGLLLAFRVVHNLPVFFKPIVFVGVPRKYSLPQVIHLSVKMFPCTSERCSLGKPEIKT